jgi:ubiquitin C-terminal hydrolase
MSTLEDEINGTATSSLSDILKFSLSDSLMGVAKTRLGSFSAPSQSMVCPMRGMLTSTLTCCRCNVKLPVRYEFIDSLSLPLTIYQSTQEISLDKCLHQYMTSELVQGVECPSCSQSNGTKTKNTFTKQLHIGRSPKVLCLHFIRTVWEGTDNGLLKNPTHLRLPLILDITKYSKSHNQELKYNNNLIGSSINIQLSGTSWLA